MDKVTLEKRLAEIEGAVQRKNSEIQQSMADMNFLLGQKAEIQEWLKQPEEVKEIAVDPELIECAVLDNATETC